METSLAIYEALIQANVPAAAARRAAESLEKDMTSSLATKQDLQLVKQDILHFEQIVTTRFDALVTRFDALTARFDASENRVSLLLQNLETRIVVKLGALMTILFGVVGAALAILR